MKAVFKILMRVVVFEFFKANAGFFLITAALLFGFLKTPQHVDIAGALALNPIYYLIPLGLWCLYTLKVYLFVTRVKRLPANLFLSDLILQKPIQRKLALIVVQIVLLSPILNYGAFLAAMALKLGQLQSLGLVVSGHLLIFMVSAHFLHAKLIQPVDAKSASKFASWMQRMPRRLPTLFIHHLFNRLPLALLFTKLFSFAIVIGGSLLFQRSQNDLRLLSLSILLAAALNSTLTLRQVEFSANQLRIFKNLPISIGKRFAIQMVTYTLLMAPEMAILIGNNLSDLVTLHLLKIMFLFLSLMLLYHAIAEATNANMERFIKYIFFITAILFFVILGYAEPLILAAAFFIMSFFILSKSVDLDDRLG